MQKQASSVSFLNISKYSSLLSSNIPSEHVNSTEHYYLYILQISYIDTCDNI